MSAHILLTTDFSDASAQAVQTAKDLVAALDGRLTVLHVVHTHAIRPVGAPLAPPMTLPVDQDALATARRTLPNWVLGQFGRAEDADCVTVIGADIAVTVAEQARKLEADYVVMSTHGRSGLEHFFLGSVTERVLRLTHVPVVCVPNRKD